MKLDPVHPVMPPVYVDNGSTWFSLGRAPPVDACRFNWTDCDGILPGRSCHVSCVRGPNGKILHSTFGRWLSNVVQFTKCAMHFHQDFGTPCFVSPILHGHSHGHSHPVLSQMPPYLGQRTMANCRATAPVGPNLTSTSPPELDWTPPNCQWRGTRRGC